MAEEIAFRYVGFHDLPLVISINYRGMRLLLSSYFDVALDEYTSFYEVYLVGPAGDVLGDPMDWEWIEKECRLIGTIEKTALAFDDRKREFLTRQTLEPKLDPLLRSAGVLT